MDHPWDAGLQPERTALAWVRTSLTVLAVGCLPMRGAATGGSAWPVLLALLALVLAALVAAIQVRAAAGRRARLATGGEVHAPAAAALLTAGVVALGVGSLFTVVG